jgi:hypothetical protein
MTSNTDDFIWTDDRLKKILLDNGRGLDFFTGLRSPTGGGVYEKLKDHHVMDVLTNHVNANLVTCIVLDFCRGINNDTLIQISNMCPQLEIISVKGCDITDDGIVGIAEKYGQQLKILLYSECTKCTDAALESIVNNCNQLEILYAENCGISYIPENIGTKLRNLQYLDLQNNKITKIPPSLTLLKDTLKDEYFVISGNPLQEPPIEIVDQGFAAIERYAPDWLKIYPSLNDRGINLSIIDDFMALDLKPMIDDIKKENKAGKFGYLPLMMGCSVGQLGALNAESFAERVNSAAKLLIDDKNTALADNLIDQLVVLRMNRSFMEFMRSHKHARDGSTIVPGLDNSN